MFHFSDVPDNLTIYLRKSDVEVFKGGQRRNKRRVSNDKFGIPRAAGSQRMYMRTAIVETIWVRSGILQLEMQLRSAGNFSTQ